MNLAIDIGNSFSKVGVFDYERKVLVSSIPNLTLEYLSDLISEHDINRLIYSSVAGEKEAITRVSELSEIEVLNLNSRTNIPIKINYSTPDTLGPDRIAAIVAAYNKFRNTNVLVIDAGTAVTFDILTSMGIYEGGNISPGLSMRFKSLNVFTGKLPLVIPDNKYSIEYKGDKISIFISTVQEVLYLLVLRYTIPCVTLNRKSRRSASGRLPAWRH